MVAREIRYFNQHIGRNKEQLDNIFLISLCFEQPFVMDTFLEVLRAYELHIHVHFSFGLTLRMLNNNGTMTYCYFHSSHNNAVMLSEVEMIGSDADIARFKDTFDKTMIFTYCSP